jgi:hypothetical protein
MWRVQIHAIDIKFVFGSFGRSAEHAEASMIGAFFTTSDEFALI